MYIIIDVTITVIIPGNENSLIAGNNSNIENNKDQNTVINSLYVLVDIENNIIYY